MKKNLIKINRSSIKRNKNAGQTRTLIPGATEIEFRADFLPDFFKDNENCYINEWQEENGKKINIKGVIIDPDVIEKCREQKLPVTIKLERNVNEIIHGPIPEFDFEYENTKLTCNYCNREIYSFDLESKEFFDGDDEYFVTKICPKCGTPDCVELEFENIYEAIKEIEI